jgi:hypothetical protein
VLAFLVVYAVCTSRNRASTFKQVSQSCVGLACTTLPNSPETQLFVLSGAGARHLAMGTCIELPGILPRRSATHFLRCQSCFPRQKGKLAQLHPCLTYSVRNWQARECGNDNPQMSRVVPRTSADFFVNRRFLLTRATGEAQDWRVSKGAELTTRTIQPVSYLRLPLPALKKLLRTVSHAL